MMVSHLLSGRWRGAGGRGLSLCHLADALNWLGNWTESIYDGWSSVFGVGLWLFVNCKIEDSKWDISDIYRLLEWRRKYEKERTSPPKKKEPSSLLCTTRLSTCRVIGVASLSSRGPSSCRRDATHLSQSGIKIIDSNFHINTLMLTPHL